MKLTIMCPCYNEEHTCAEVISQLKNVDVGMEKEIIVVDDGSRDGSFNELKKIEGIRLYQHIVNKGKGAAIRTAIENATGDILVPFDLDTEYDVNDLNVCLKAMFATKASVVYGSRRLMKENKQFSGISFYIGGIGITMVTNFLYNSRLTDEPTCLKMATKQLYTSLNLTSDGFEWEPEMTAKILKRNINIVEVPIHYYPRTKQQGKKIKWKDGFKAIWALLKYKVTQ